MSSLIEQMMKDSMAPDAPTNNELTEISKLAERQMELQTLVNQLTAELATTQELLRNVSEKLLPDAMAIVGMKEFRLESGQKISIKDDIFASIRADQSEAAFMWLDEHGLGDVVKDEIKINLGRGQSQNAPAFIELAKSMGVAAAEKLSVHPQTLKALVKEQMAQGVEFPETCFSVMPFKKAIIK